MRFIAIQEDDTRLIMEAKTAREIAQMLLSLPNPDLPVIVPDGNGDNILITGVGETNAYIDNSYTLKPVIYLDAYMQSEHLDPENDNQAK